VSLLVTGASGFLGSELLRHDPSAVASPRSSELDVRDATGVRDFLEAVRPEAVIHAAYRQEGQGAYETMVDGSRNVAEAARGAGARLVHMSTDVLFDGLKRSPYVEHDPPTPVTEYGRAKAAAEAAVRAAHPEALIVRTSLIYAGDGTSRHERIALEAARGERDMAFFTDELRSPVQVGDLAGALLRAAAAAASGILHLGGGDGVSRHEFARLVAVANGVDPAGLRAASIGESALTRPRDCRLDSSRAQDLLGVRLRGARQVLAPDPAPN
jgi:dTDP-4-dehydrorhamnose reductase